MRFDEAHNYMDILLDKADQPYFTVAEKDRFLTMAINEWFDEAIDLFDVDVSIAEALKHMIIVESAYLYYYGAILMATRTDGKHVIPLHSHRVTTGVRKGAKRALGYPLKKVLNLAVKYWDEYSKGRTAYTECSRVLSEDHFQYALESEQISDNPFTQPSHLYPQYTVQSDYIRIMPYTTDTRGPREYESPRYLLNAMSHSRWTGIPGWSSSSTGYTSSSGMDYGNAGFYRIKFITYPMASNVEGGNLNLKWSRGVQNVGTKNCVVGAIMPKRDFLFDPTQASASLQAIDTTNGEVFNDGYSRCKYKGWPDNVCIEICKKAVRTMTGVVESPNYPVLVNETNK
jgi:hypothetical protein